MSDIKKGDFIKVNRSLGVVIALQGEPNVPEDHLLIWYGESEGNVPKARTVPKEYCEPMPSLIIYH